MLRDEAEFGMKHSAELEGSKRSNMAKVAVAKVPSNAVGEAIIDGRKNKQKGRALSSSWVSGHEKGERRQRFVDIEEELSWTKLKQKQLV